MALEPQFEDDLTIVGQLVHNRQVNEALNKDGISLINGVDGLDGVKTKKVMITAHGAAEKMKTQLTEAGFVVFDAVITGNACTQPNQIHGG